MDILMKVYQNIYRSQS